MARLKALARELRLAEAFLALAVLGFALSSDTLALLGCLGTLLVALLALWERSCLAGVSYSRRLERHRAGLGESVGLELEIVNDKILPLSFLEIDDEVPYGLRIEGGATVTGFSRRSARLVQVLPLLPYQRVRRRMLVSCDRRGEHRFGPATLTSGDPVGRGTRSEVLAETEQLLVYPRILPVSPEGVLARVLLGDLSSRSPLGADPLRAAGVRAYSPGDPLRHVDWRATARTGELLVRRFEPTVSPRIAVVLDVLVPQVRGWSPDPDELEFAVASTASILSALARGRIPVGLYTTGSAGGRPVAHPPSRDPSALPAMLESLARLLPSGTPFVERVLLAASSRLPGQTSLVVIAADFPRPLLAAIDEVRRHHALTAVHLALGGDPPPTERVDALLHAPYAEDWQSRKSLELLP